MPSFKYLNGTNTIGTGTYKFKHINHEAPPTNPYLTFSSPTSFTMARSEHSYNDGTLQYSTDKATWTTFTTTAVTSVLNGSNYELYFRGIGNTYVRVNTSGWPYFSISGTNVSCSGNIETLLDYATVGAGNHPTMAENCYFSMFYGCTSLTTAPALPATALASNCYSSMFEGCTSLVNASALPATTLADDCYSSMFKNCTSLVNVPALPATILVSACYSQMFSSCTSLTSAPTLPATTLADNCYNGMFYNCTSLVNVPALPATTLATWCYSTMFYGCTSLKLSTTQTGNYTIPYRIPTTGTGTVGSNSLYNMFTSTGGTFTGKPSINTTYYLWSE